MLLFTMKRLLSLEAPARVPSLNAPGGSHACQRAASRSDEAHAHAHGGSASRAFTSLALGPSALLPSAERRDARRRETDKRSRPPWARSSAGA